MCYLCAGMTSVLSMCRDDKCVFYVQECQVCYLCAGMTSVLSMCRNDKCVIYVQG